MSGNVQAAVFGRAARSGMNVSRNVIKKSGFSVNFSGKNPIKHLDAKEYQEAGCL